MSHPSIERRWRRRRWADQKVPVPLESDPRVVVAFAALALAFALGFVVGLIVGRFVL